MAELNLPYEAWEIILHYLDGASILALSCVSRESRQMCKSFLAVRGAGYWKEACLKDLNADDFILCQSGLLKENWYAVYKSSLIKNTIQSRNMTRINIPLVPRFIRHRTEFHILGSMLVVTQGPLINIYDALTGQHIQQRQIGSYNIHASFLQRKHGRSSAMPLCDVLIFLCGGTRISHMAATTAHTILLGNIAVVPLPGSVNITGIEFGLERCSPVIRVDNCCICFAYIHVDIRVDLEGFVKLENIGNCDAVLVVEKDTAATPYSVLTSTVMVYAWPGNIILETDIQRQTTVPLETHLWPDSYNAREEDWARLIHVGDEVVPVIALLHKNETDTKQLVLYTFPLYQTVCRTIV